MNVLTKYSIVCQVPGAEPYTICAYTGGDLTKVLGITQANLPEGHYGWIQECGEALVSVSGQTQAAYADFRPNAAKRYLTEELSKGSMGYALIRSLLLFVNARQAENSLSGYIEYDRALASIQAEYKKDPVSTYYTVDRLGDEHQVKFVP